MVIAGNFIVVIAESQSTGFKVQRGREIPSNASKHRFDGLSSLLQDFFFILVEVTFTDNTAGFPSGNFCHEEIFLTRAI
jgi:hypothetical protein